jgi:peptidoglycan/LPS O-acetylase OafA/YrhL
VTTVSCVFDVRLFARRRIQRLFPPLAAALVLTIGLDRVGSAINPDFYAGRVDFWTSPFFATASHSVSTLLGNVLFQGSFVVQPFGTNGPLWSLAFEFWFYVLYPILLLLTIRYGPWSLLLVPGAMAVIAYAVLPANQPAPGGGLGLTADGWWIAEAMLYWIVWTLGAAIAEAYVGRFHIAAPWYLGLVTIAVVARWITPPASSTWIGGWMLNDLLWSAMFAIVLSVWLVARPASIPRALLRIAESAGAVSYSLYLVHIPVIAFVSACWFSARQPIPVGLELALPTAVLATAVAVLTWHVVERPFQRPHAATLTIGARAEPAVSALSTEGSSSA